MNSFFKISILKILCLFFCIPVNAGISTLAFKNVFGCFKPEKAHCAPNFGAIALRTGIIENIRLNLVQQAFDSNGRDYKRDKSYDDKDPIVNMVLILFPSHAGQLATEANTNDNLGKHCTVEHIANVLKFTSAVRTYFAHSKAAPLPQNMTKVPAKLGLTSDWITKNLPTEASITKNRNNLLTNIIQAVQQEKLNTFYPKYLTEQIITAFFCHKFTTSDISTLLKALGNDFVDQTKAFTQEFITKDDVQNTMAKDNASLNLDDIWILLNNNEISSTIPYSSSPVSNGLAKMYTKNPVQEFNTTFADCTESVVRHILNVTLYDSVLKKFDLSKLIEHMKLQNPAFDPEQDSTFKWFKEFYDKQTPDKANDGTQVTRSLWNKVVADLGNDIEYLKDAGGKKSNELNSGMINILQVLHKLFDLKLKQRPPKTGDSEFITQAEKWIEASFETFFSRVSNNNFILKFTDLKTQSSSKYGDIVGKVMITASKGSEKLYSYTIHSMQGHAQIEDLKTLQHSIQNIMYTQKIKTLLEKNTIFESILLLENSFKKNIKHLFYILFSEPINDSNAIINTLEKLHALLEKNKLNDSLVLGAFVKNILSIFPWQDQEASKNIQEIILKLKASAGVDKVHLLKTLKENVKGFILSNKTAQDLTDFFINIEYLFIDQIESYEFVPASAHAIKSIILLDKARDFLKKLTGFEHCQSLESLNLSGPKVLAEIVFSQTMNSLKVIDISSSNIIKITGLKHCQNLEQLTLSSIKNQKEVVFSQPMNSLKILDFFNLNIKKITGLEYCQNLEKIELSNIKNLEEVVFSQPMNSLKEIALDNLNIKKITGLKHCQNLEQLTLCEIINLEEVVFSQPMNSLKIIYLLLLSNIKKITGLEHCQNLEQLALCGIKNLEQIVFSQPMNTLKQITIQDSGINKITGLELCKEIDLKKFKIDHPTIQLIPAPSPTKSALSKKIDDLKQGLGKLKDKLLLLKNSLEKLKAAL